MSWILDYVPYWVWVVAAVAALAATYPFWSAIWFALPNWLKIALIGTAGLIVAYLAGRNRGTKNAKDAQDKANAQATKQRLETNAEVTNLNAADRKRQFDKWLRD